MKLVDSEGNVTNVSVTPEIEVPIMFESDIELTLFEFQTGIQLEPKYPTRVRLAELVSALHVSHKQTKLNF